MKERTTPISLYKSEDTNCGYIDKQQSSSVYANPYDAPEEDVYNHLIQFGFRRSGNLIYKPDCETCLRCIPVRLQVNEFKANRRFRRILKRNSDLTVRPAKAALTDEYFDLYTRYLSGQHAGGSMENPSEADFESFLVSDWLTSMFIDIRKNERLVAVAVTDIVTKGLSSVYTFYDPDEKKRSLGNFSIMQQIEIARIMNLPYLYLGYWIQACKKMSYKSDFQPLQYYIENTWINRERFEALIKSRDGDSDLARLYV